VDKRIVHGHSQLFAYETRSMKQVIKVYGRSWYVTPRILNLDNVWVQVISFTLQPLLSPYLLNRRLGGPQRLSGDLGRGKSFAFAGNLTKVTWMPKLVIWSLQRTRYSWKLSAEISDYLLALRAKNFFRKLT